MKNMFLSSALLASLAFSGQASALDTSSSYEVRFISGETASAGTWTLRLSSSGERNCRYRLEWKNGNEEPQLCTIEERKVEGNEDCSVNSTTNFNTTIRNDLGRLCRGFDRNNIERSIAELFLEEDKQESKLRGTLRFTGSSTVHEIEVQLGSGIK